MNKIIYYLFAVFFILFLLQNCKINKLKPEEKSSSLINNILVAYGEEIYLRESCGQCHTQKIGKENKQQFSLDGLGDKYTNDWLFQYLSDPRSMNPYSTMPSYPHIISNKLNKKTLKSILKERYSNTDFNLKKNWKELKIQLDANVKNYKDKPFLAKNKSEIVALIAYLQSIPSGKNLLC